jgi:hypothetical protein
LTESVVGPENPEMVGGLFEEELKCAVQYARVMISGTHARKVHIAGLVGVSREHVLQPSNQLLQLKSSAGFCVVALHSPS